MTDSSQYNANLQRGESIKSSKATNRVITSAGQSSHGSSSSGPHPLKIEQRRVMERGKEGRFEFVVDDRVIYQWEQSLEEVNIYVRPPHGVTSDMITCEIANKHVTLGLRGNPPFINEDTFGQVKTHESFWLMNDGEININLQKLVKASTWEAAFKGVGGSIDPFSREEVQKKIMLERFQEENPGFDFSQAKFDGAAPDPTTFMGGVRYA